MVGGAKLPQGALLHGLSSDLLIFYETRVRRLEVERGVAGVLWFSLSLSYTVSLSVWPVPIPGSGVLGAGFEKDSTL